MPGRVRRADAVRYMSVAWRVPRGAVADGHGQRPCTWQQAGKPQVAWGAGGAVPRRIRGVPYCAGVSLGVMNAGEHYLQGDLEVMRRDGWGDRGVGCCREGGRVAGWDAARVPGSGLARADRGQPGRDAGVGRACGSCRHRRETEAVNRAIEAPLGGEPQPAPFHVLVRREQRKMLRAVPRPDSGES